MPYDSMKKGNRKLAAGHNLGLKSTELQRPRPATRVDFTEFESTPVDQHERHAPSQPEIAVNPEQVPLTYGPTFSSPHATSDREPSATPQGQSLRDVTELDGTTDIPPPTATPPSEEHDEPQQNLRPGTRIDFPLAPPESENAVLTSELAPPLSRAERSNTPILPASEHI
jgi:hypothetical protein